MATSTIQAPNPWLLAIRPKTLFASAGPVVLGLAWCLFEGLLFNPFVAILTLLCALLLQMGTNLVNDYYDAKKGTDTKERLGPKRMTAEGLLAPEQVRSAFILCFSVALVLGLYLMQVGGLPIVIIGLASIFFAWAYTGGPFPLSYYALGEVAALIFFGPVAVWGTAFLQTGTTNILPAFVGLGPGFISAAIMAINNLRDRESDRKNRKTTLATLSNEFAARQLVIFFVILASLVPVVFALMTDQWTTLPVAFTPFIFLSTWKRILVGPVDSGLNECLAATGKFLFLYCLIFSFGLML